MEDSILNTVKKLVGVDPSYDVFDLDIITHINTAFSTLEQLGVGPEGGFAISDEKATWDSFVTDKQLNSVRTYIVLRVRLLFDPPGSSFAIDAMKEQIKELEWRMNVFVDPKVVS